MKIDFRTAREEDLERLVEIHRNAFPDPRANIERRRNFVANPFGPLDRLMVAAVDGSVAAHAFAFRTSFGFGGKLVPAVALASVGVAPEFRGRGIGTRLIEHVQDEGRNDGCAIAVLHAFRQGYYARLGYGNTTHFLRARFSPSSIPATWREASSKFVFQSVDASARSAIEALYREQMLVGTGFFERPVSMWDRKLLDERRSLFAVTRDGVTRGYVILQLSQSEPHALTTMFVDEFVSADDAARCAMFGFLSGMRDQVDEIEMSLAADDPLLHALVDGDRTRHGDARIEHELARVAGGPMIAILDVARALRSRGYSHSDKLVLDIEGRGSYALKIGPHEVHVQEQSPSAPDAAMKATTLASIAFGSVVPTAAARLGLVDAKPDALARLDALFRIPSYFAFDSF